MKTLSDEMISKLEKSARINNNYNVNILVKCEKYKKNVQLELNPRELCYYCPLCGKKDTESDYYLEHKYLGKKSELENCGHE